ncbi:unnamed protein product [Anisakis simplex]|uniref:Uncharacterized protein n=1 Tax=Anisakis simplex TaxID=6269 RepID=A0A0M3JEE9_ANISI|nr:unnamed protein product [Anisakis simplex]
MSGSVRSREEAMTGGVAGSSGVETIELVALNSDGGAEGGAVGEAVEGVECRSNDNNETSSGAYRMLNVAAVIDDHPHRSLSKRRRTVRIDEMLMGASSSDTATNNINNNNNSSSNHHQSPNKECEEWEDDASSGHPSERGMLPPTFTTLLPADSLELLNIAGTRLLCSSYHIVCFEYLGICQQRMF